MNMKKYILLLLAGVAVISSCAKKVSSSPNEDAKMLFDAWMHVNHPDLQPTPLGAYILESTPGKGVMIDENCAFVRVLYSNGTLDGSISATNREDLAKQLGKYNESYYYGPQFWSMESLYAGIAETVGNMRVGGRVKLIIPGWLMSAERYDTEEEYLQNVTGTNTIYDIEIVEGVWDIDKWQIDSLSRYVESHCGISSKDSVKLGYYYISESVPPESTAFESDTTLYINYTGRLLNGKVFDTTIKDTAVRYGIYSSGKTYEPVSVSVNVEDYTQTTFTSSGSNMIDGFSYTISQMKNLEKGSGIFIANLGYGASGTGNTIAPYAPLRFDIEIVEGED